ncbi:YeeE/YedE family protein [Alsobacter sp. SYSU M60028]|uniref:YeeE/YedE family protein n=1 Tax=Alsobacter ponti TaxID=2962936 RepID=A0ABT1LHM4_9HYPH|nr:YeeE/YedE thiosulfate transporter family protein [Alsobacter ponti]MCP8940618.1 YeeE/YedE family protein [Alsobacter ponti]
MIDFSPLHGLAGGLLIGLGAVTMMAGIGRIAGICGIVVNAMFGLERPWRLAFLAGLPAGALLAGATGAADLADLGFPASVPATVAAGLLVGFGATVGSGCTSGHGVCGLARLSPRSIAATAVFMTTAALTVFVTRHLAG